SNDINIIMPRSTMPARIAIDIMNSTHLSGVKLIFDADGLPIEERVDFAGLKQGSLRYKQLKRIEKAIVEKADVILTRTHHAIAILTEQYKVSLKKFYVVTNGRNESLFNPRRVSDSGSVRESLNIPPDAEVLVYTGSLGPQYGLDQMLYIHRKLLKKNRKYHLLILTNNPGFMER